MVSRQPGRSSRSHPHDILGNPFGYTQFRGQQKQIIDHLLGGNHALVIMPTGAGKSLCYQIPALLLAEENALCEGQSMEAENLPPLTLVLSPLVALMKDQVDALVTKRVDATYINSTLTKEQRLLRYSAIAEGRFSLLYVTPERFRKVEFLEVIEQRKVVLLAVDEAHCVSQWGHDFRPDYSRLHEIRHALGEPVTVALTATATQEVQSDIIAQLGLASTQVQIFHEGIDRPNLHLEVEEVHGEDEKMDRIEGAICHGPFANLPTIIYFTLIKTLARFSDRLQQLSLPHLVYHGDLDRSQRKASQNAFLQGQQSLVLATNAFGMGIDKEDVRQVIHAEVPGSMESYYQEVGRAGRDGLSARCLLLYDSSDLTTQMRFIEWKNPDAGFYQSVFDRLSGDQERVQAFGLEWLKKQLHTGSGHDFRLETVLAMFERYGLLDQDIEGSEFRLLDALPTTLVDPLRIAEKVRRDREKLYALVQYVQHPGDRMEFIHDYFGLPYPPAD